MTTAALTTSKPMKIDTSDQFEQLVADLVARQSDSRTENTMSVEDQIDTMTIAVERQGMRVGEIHVEKDTSGMKPLAKRRGLLRAVERVEAGLAHVVVCGYFDRLMREPSVKDQVVDRIEAKGGRVTSLDFGDISNKTAMQWYSGTITQANFKLYAMQVGEKTKPSKQRNIDNGVPPFPRITSAYDRRKDGTLTPSQHADAVREACKMRAANPPASYAKIARFLRERGVTVTIHKKNTPPRVVPITLSATKSMLSSKLLIGEIHFGDFTPNLQAGEQWGGTIIDRATFRAMHERKATRGRYSKSDRLLARLHVLTCKTCGSYMTVHSSRAGRDGKSYPYYRCGRRYECANPASIAADVVEKRLLDEALKLSKSIKGRAAAVTELEDARLDRVDVEQRIADTIETLTDLGLMGEPTSKKKLAELSVERDAKVARHERLVALTTPDMTISNIDALSVATLDEKRRLITMTIALASVVPGTGKDRVVEIVSHTLAQ